MALGGVPTGSMKSRLVDIPTTVANMTGLTPVEVPRPMEIGRKMPALAVLLAMILIPRPKTATNAIVKTPDLPPVSVIRLSPILPTRPETSRAEPRLRPPPMRSSVFQLALGRSLSSTRPDTSRSTAMTAATTLEDMPWPGQPMASASGSGSLPVTQSRMENTKTMSVSLCLPLSALDSNSREGILLTSVGKTRKRTAQIAKIRRTLIGTPKNIQPRKVIS